ncbi:4-hydroxy-tetrahydrodipicolinate synthase [archaeon HR01]|nr:4-hydroxy-tetrahydrodipicolinate synthase [archaeon HR01]
MELLDFEGVISATLTPTVDLREKMAELVEFHLRNGVRGFFVLGTTGEGAKLGRERRAEVAEAAVEAAGSKGLVIIHVGSSDIDTVLWLAKHAARIGAHAVSAVAPFYYRYDSQSLINFYQTLANTVDIPVLLYNNPGRQGYSIPFEELSRILETVRPRLGLKDSSGDPDILLQAIQRYGGERFLASGGDHLMAYSFIIGYRAHISSLATIYPEIAAGIHRYVRDGRIEEALRLQNLLNRVRAILKKIGPDLASNRYALLRRGVDIGGPIPPTRQLTEQEAETLDRLLPREEEIAVKP